MSKSNQGAKNPKQTAIAITGKSITDEVLEKIKTLDAGGALHLPDNYSPANALNSAYLLLSQQVDKDNNPVLEVCSRVSVANALLNMVVEGLSPIKSQCYFIPYKDTLNYQRSYMGDIHLAKRDAKVVKIVAQAVFKGDEFKWEISGETGIKKILKHEQSLENLDPEITKVIGAYAILTFEDGTTQTEIMSMPQIKKAWLQGYAKGNSPAHRNFPDEMAKKTVISRACKPHINSSDDSTLRGVNDRKTIEVEGHTDKQEELNEKASTETISFEEVKEPVKTPEEDKPVDNKSNDKPVEEVKEEKPKEQPKESPGF